MENICFDDADLLTKDELATRLVERSKALVVFEEDDEPRLRLFHSFFPEDDEQFKRVPELLRAIADQFEDCEHHPREVRP